MDRETWLKSRKSCIGSSDAAAIMGLSPWKTPLQIYEDKIDPNICEETSFIMERGNRMEPRIRALVELLKGESFAPAICQMEQYPFMRASLDGKNIEGTEIIEIKYCSQRDYDLVKKTVVPDKYFPQVQHQLLVTGARVNHFCCYPFEKEEPLQLDRNKLVMMSVMPNTVFQEKMLAECVAFWEHVTNRNPPEPMLRDFTPMVGIPETAIKWKKLNSCIKELEEQRAILAEELTAAAVAGGAKRYLCAGLKIIDNESGWQINEA